MGSLRMAFKMAFAPLVALALVGARGESECPAGECDSEENTLLALRQNVSLHDDMSSDTRRRLPPAHCKNPDGTPFNCAGGDTCCGAACVGMGDLCCKNVKGDHFPCQGGGECCGNACAAPGSKCCKPAGPKSGWYPVSKATECRGESTQCTNGQGASFQCAESDSCCGGACVSRGDACCQNVLGNHFPCQVNKWGEGGCCGNACYAPGSKCCWSPWVAKARWYPVTKATKCAF